MYKLINKISFYDIIGFYLETLIFYQIKKKKKDF